MERHREPVSTAQAKARGSGLLPPRARRFGSKAKSVGKTKREACRRVVRVRLSLDRVHARDPRGGLGGIGVCPRVVSATRKRTVARTSRVNGRFPTVAADPTRPRDGGLMGGLRFRTRVDDGRSGIVSPPRRLFGEVGHPIGMSAEGTA